MTSTETRSQPPARAAGGDARWERLALAGGLLFAVVQVAAAAYTTYFLLTTHPPVDATPVEAARGFADSAAMVATGTFLYVLHLPFWLVFLAGLVTVLRRDEGRDGPLATAALGAGIAMTVIASMGALVSAVVPTIGQLGGDSVAAGAVVKALDGATPLALALSGFPRAVLLAAVAVAVFRSGVAARWIGWTGVVLALVSLAATGTLVSQTLFPVTSLAALLFTVWVAALAASLLRRGVAR